jgi:hypothetical protein
MMVVIENRGRAIAGEDERQAIADAVGLLRVRSDSPYHHLAQVSALVGHLLPEE